MTNKTRKWLRSLIEILIHGGASAVVAAIMSVKQSGGWFFASSQFWQVVTAQFAVSGGLRFFQFLSTHPVPDEETTPLFQPTPQISLNPLAKVQPLPKDTANTEGPKP